MKSEFVKKQSPLKWVPTVYFGMGLPFVALSMVSVLMFSEFGVGNAKIAFWTSLIMLPWTLKPLWSPFLEMFRTKKFFVVGTQMVTGLSFVMVALSLPLDNFFTYSIALMGLIAFSGATHDIAGDGIYLTELDKKTQAKYIGWQGAFYNLAKILANGGLVFLAGQLKGSWGTLHAWMAIMAIIGGIMLLLSLWHSRVLPTGKNAEGKKRTAGEVWRETIGIYADFFRKKHIIWYIFFIVIYRLAEGFAVKIVPLFLKAPVADGGLGMDVSEIGIIYGTFGTVAFILGSILAGYYISARGLKKALFSLVCAFYLPNLAYVLLAVFQPSSLWIIGSGIVLEYFGYGFGFVGLTLFMMQQVAPGKHTMAHYAFATGIMNLGVMFPGMMSGWLSDMIGYKSFFIFVMVMTIPAFAAALKVPFTQPDIEGDGGGTVEE